MDIVPTGNASANEFSIGSTPPPLTDPSPVQASSAPSASATASARRDSLTFVQRWARPTIVEARQLCYLSIGLTILTTVIGLAVAVAGKSAATLGYSLESAVDVVSSIFVLWRFWGGDNDEGKLASREKRASVCIAANFVLLALIVFGQACSHLSHAQSPADVGALLGLAIPSVFILAALGGLKLHVARRLHSGAMKKDGICSLSAAGLSFGISVGVGIYQNDPAGWWVDGAFAIVISLCLGAYGARTLLKNKWWTRAFWSPVANRGHRMDDNDDERGGANLATNRA